MVYVRVGVCVLVLHAGQRRTFSVPRRNVNKSTYPGTGGRMWVHEYELTNV